MERSVLTSRSPPSPMPSPEPTGTDLHSSASNARHLGNKNAAGPRRNKTECYLDIDAEACSDVNPEQGCEARHA